MPMNRATDRQGYTRMLRCYRQYCMFILLATVVVVSCSLVYALEGSADAGIAENVGPGHASNTASDSSDVQPDSPPINTKRTTSSGDEDDWGSFYDPNKVFCGKFDCYKILGFDYETWGAHPPTLKEITKSYRALSRKWHPDKNKAKGAREKFVVSRTYCRLFLLVGTRSCVLIDYENRFFIRTKLNTIHGNAHTFILLQPNFTIFNLYTGHCQSIRNPHKQRQAR